MPKMMGPSKDAWLAQTAASRKAHDEAKEGLKAAADRGTAGAEEDDGLRFVPYRDENDCTAIKAMIDQDLSEPYSVFTYRYFLNQWPELCVLCLDGDTMIGAVVGKMELHKSGKKRGYIAMLAVDKKYRKRGIGRKLAQQILQRMQDGRCEECVLEAEVTNLGALNLYRSLGFVKHKRLTSYYLNNSDAFRLKLSFSAIQDADLKRGPLPTLQE